MTQNIKEKKLHIAILRILALFMIIYNHTAAYLAFPNSHLYILPAMLCKIGVPIFFMISGALLLNKQETIEQLYKKRIFRMVLALILISAIAYLFNAVRADNLAGCSIPDFLRQLQHCSIDASYWYLYSYIGLLCCMPLLRPMVQNMSVTVFYYFTAFIFVLTGLIPVIQTFIPVNYTIHLSFPMMISNHVWLMVAGYFVEHRPEEVNRKAKSTVSILVIVLVLLLQFLLVCLRGFDSPDAFNLISHAAFIMAPCVYLLAQAVFPGAKLREPTRKSLFLLGDCVFGMYLFQYIFLRLTDPLCWALMNYVGVFFACVIQILLIMIAGCVVTALLRRIPYLGKLF